MVELRLLASARSWLPAFFCQVRNSIQTPFLNVHSTLDVLGPFVSVLVNAWDCRVVILIGSVVSTLGLVLASFAKDVFWLIISFGVVTGKS